jgi:nitric oxide reductase subunit C
MLAKSQARLMFLVTTIGFSAVFLGLTIDTVMQMPARTNEKEMSPAVVRGKGIWEDNNCMGCHTILGEGAYYAPELTKVVERRGVPWIRVFLKDPQAMFPGQRKMVKYDFTDAEIDDVAAFLTWIGTIDTNGFPAKPDMGAPQAPPASAPAGAGSSATAHGPPPPAMVTQVCQACHAVGGVGGVVGPSFDGVGQRFDREKLDAWLKDPQAVKPGTAMPNLGLTDAVRAELVTWLLTQ